MKKIVHVPPGPPVSSTLKVITVNNILKRVCKLNWFGFIDNSNICVENLFEDSLHLNDDGKVILANNFIYVLNTFILWHEKKL